MDMTTQKREKHILSQNSPPPPFQAAPFSPPWWLGQTDLQTVVAGKWPRPSMPYARERIELPDDDFLDLDWMRQGAPRLAVISHGLEGHSQRTYMTGMVATLHRRGWDVLAWNQRSCSGEINRAPRLYHNGVTDDLGHVITHAADSGDYAAVALVGFSLGGNLSLLYLGREEIHPKIRAAVAFSVPCDLTSASIELARPRNQLYMRYFLRSLRQKVREKAAQYPQLVSEEGYDEIRDFLAFDDRYTAPLHGFRDGRDYWEQCSSAPWLERIPVPALLVNAQDDPFLSEECYPWDACKKNAKLHLLAPKRGGHCAFLDHRHERWSERTAADYLEQQCPA
jgi:uncharacterized protein